MILLWTVPDVTSDGSDSTEVYTICVGFLAFMGVPEGHSSRHKLRARGAYVPVGVRLHGGYAARAVCAVALNNPNQLIWCTPPYIM